MAGCTIGRRVQLFVLALLMTSAMAIAAEKEVERKTITIRGKKLELLTGEEVKALGFPWIDVPDEENAATYYIGGANALRDKYNEEVTSQREHVVRNVWDDRLAALARRLEVNQEALALYRKGASMEQCQLPYSTGADFAGMRTPTLPAARSAAFLLSTEARRFEANAQFKKAIDNYVAAIRVGEHYGRGRGLLDQRIGTTVIRITLQAASRGTYRHPYPDRSLGQFLKQLNDLGPSLPRLEHGVRCDKAFTLACVSKLMRCAVSPIDMIVRMTGDEELRTLSPLEQRLARILLPDRTAKKDIAAWYDRRIEAARKPFPEFWETELKKEDLRLKRWNIVGFLLLPALGRARVEVERCRARFDILRLAIALKMYHLDHGAYPEKLAALAPNYLKELPNDPFNGEAFRYKVEGGHFVLYSVGENLKDDGGKVHWTADGRPADVGVTSKLPPLEQYHRKTE